jgi:hypothetical protein
MLELHRQVNGTVSEKFYDSFYVGNPCGQPLLGLCRDGETLVGQENYVCQDIASGGVVRRGAMGINTMVHQDYRLLHGVFGKLCKLTINNLLQRVDFLYAFAIEESKKYYVKYFNFKTATSVGVYKKITSPSGFRMESILAYARPGRRHAELELDQVDRFDPDEMDPVLERYLAKSRHNYFRKTTEFIKWKFLANRHYEVRAYRIKSCGRCVGYCLTYDANSERRIVDFIIEGDDAVICARMMGTLAWQAKKDGIQRLVAYGTPGCWYESILKMQLFIKRWDFDFIIRSCGTDLASQQWIVHGGDFDMF